MASSQITLRCPKCLKKAKGEPADLKASFTCPTCGQVTPWGELYTPSGAKLIDHITDIAVKKLGKRSRHFKSGR